MPNTPMIVIVMIFTVFSIFSIIFIIWIDLRIMGWGFDLFCVRGFRFWMRFALFRKVGFELIRRGEGGGCMCLGFLSFFYYL